MNPPTLPCARAVRDAGIDAIAALDSGLAAALSGLSDEEAGALKMIFGRLMGKVIDELVNPAVRAFPELAADNATWAEIARERATRRATPPAERGES